MTNLLARVGAVFVAPSPPATPLTPALPREAEADAPAGLDAHDLAGGTPADVTPPARALVLGDPTTGPPVGAALAGELRRRARCGAAVVCTWSAGPLGRGEQTTRAGGSPAARRLAARLAARELDAVARGRLVWVALPPGPDAAMADLARASAVVEEPLVLSAAGARPAAFDVLLDDLDLIVVTPPPTASAAVLALALADLASIRAPVVVRDPIPRGARRWLALAGHGRLRGRDDLRLPARALE